MSLFALAFSIYGYTLLLSTIDLVRWRPNLIGSVLTLGGYVAFVISIVPVMQDSRWKPWLERISIFKAYNPVEAVRRADHLAFNIGVLGGIGLAGVILGFLIFQRRDLPTSG
ncbi:MAG: hypothetical protein IRY99_22575 [Isosphaeraceae bacterium]|nr:hypothetical protein [Isosphaeraceae bacterium]